MQTSAARAGQLSALSLARPALRPGPCPRSGAPRRSEPREALAEDGPAATARRKGGPHNEGPSAPPQALARSPSPDLARAGHLAWRLPSGPPVFRSLYPRRCLLEAARPLPSHRAGERAAEPVPR